MTTPAQDLVKNAQHILMTCSAQCLSCQQFITQGERAWWVPRVGFLHERCFGAIDVGPFARIKTITGERFRRVPPQVRAALTSQARLGVLLILAGFLVDVMLAMKVLAYETQPSWVLTCVLFGPGVLLMMFGSHLISKKFSGAVGDLIRAVRGTPTP